MSDDKYQPPRNSSAIFQLRTEHGCAVCGGWNKLVVVIYTAEDQEVASGFEICGDCIDKLNNIKTDFLDRINNGKEKIK